MVGLPYKPTQYSVAGAGLLYKPSQYSVAGAGLLYKPTQYSVAGAGLLFKPTQYSVAGAGLPYKPSQYSMAGAGLLYKPTQYSVAGAGLLYKPPQYSLVELDRTLPVLEPDFSVFLTPPPSGIRHLWIGHSTSLVQFDGVTILTDPVFSDRCSPLKFVGNKRYRPPPCTVATLPKVDFVLISNSHYDHLDYASVVALNERFGDGIQWYGPMGLKKWLNNCGCSKVVELTWWQTHMFNEDLNVAVVCTPCQHWGKRTSKDDNKVLWSSWCVIGPRHSFHFSGDTAYCEGYRQIGRCYGPFTLSTIPIGGYSPRDIMSNMHVDPQNAVTIHEDLRSQASIGIHWGTFSLSFEPYLEPRELLDSEIQRKKMKPSSFFTVNHGEITLVGADGFDEID
ncbi:N-acyl-phosphatidylethanolamine-hydrolyzing phospholipase d [Plakobranchus ocellatus]|uniref:N-acyl-phosphatidylethanolamine-hydrolyzing phospholipase d n=1 Tax=Plakobranchus ocellatus TaxID=259542 RepID=A0AAV4DKX4_9GAST|nr:N-acyl-phosphatidylethanolamine-hydrolyzing phospholipase d [Plakobranchus ocellatus]